MTYAQLDQKTNQLARYLQTLGAGRDIPVAVLMERSFDLIVAVMGRLLVSSRLSTAVMLCCCWELLTFCLTAGNKMMVSSSCCILAFIAPGWLQTDTD